MNGLELFYIVIFRFCVHVNDCEFCDKISAAFTKVCDIFEESTISVLRYHLEEKYSIRFEPPCSTLEEIEVALVDITGIGATLIMQRMKKFLR